MSASPSLRVAFDGRSLSGPVLRGWDRYTVGLVGALADAGVQVSLVFRATDPIREEHVRGLGCELVPLEDRGGLHWLQVALPRFLRRGRFDVYHAPAEQGVPFAQPCPAVLTVHSVTGPSYADLVARGLLPGPVSTYLGYEPRAASLAGAYWRLQVARARHVFVPSEFCREEARRFLGVPPGRLTTTPLAVHAQFREPPRPAPERSATLTRHGVRPPYVLYVGGYEPHKNVDGLLEAFGHLRAARPDMSLVLVGSRGVPAPLRERADALGLAGATTFLADLRDELTTLYDEAALVATLSWRETFCLPALEAFARGVPVVASRWGAAPEVIGRDEVAGRLVDPRDPREAAAAMSALLDSPDRLALASAARARAAGFGWQRTAELTASVYERLARARRAGA